MAGRKFSIDNANGFCKVRISVFGYTHAINITLLAALMADDGEFMCIAGPCTVGEQNFSLLSHSLAQISLSLSQRGTPNNRLRTAPLGTWDKRVWVRSFGAQNRGPGPWVLGADPGTHRPLTPGAGGEFLIVLRLVSL